MMPLPDLVDALALCGAELTPFGDRLKVTLRPGALPIDVRKAVEVHRDALHRIARGEVDIDDPSTPLDLRIAAWRSRPDVAACLQFLDRMQARGDERR